MSDVEYAMRIIALVREVHGEAATLRAAVEDGLATIQQAKQCARPCEDCGLYYAPCNGCAGDVWELLPKRLQEALEGRRFTDG